MTNACLILLLVVKKIKNLFNSIHSIFLYNTTICFICQHTTKENTEHYRRPFTPVVQNIIFVLWAYRAAHKPYHSAINENKRIRQDDSQFMVITATDQVRILLFKGQIISFLQFNNLLFAKEAIFSMFKSKFLSLLLLCVKGIATSLASHAIPQMTSAA